LIGQEKRAPHRTTHLRAVSRVNSHWIRRAGWGLGPIERFRTLWSVAKGQIDIVAVKFEGKSCVDCHRDVARHLPKEFRDPDEEE
jgi:hypothetical protein